MTSKEAVNLFKQYRWSILTSFKDKNKALEILEELVERDTPEKIEYNDYDDPCCPVCGEVQCTNVYAMNNIHCPYCGQRLDWSALNDK